MKKINKLFELAGFDGCKHIIVSAVLSAVLSLVMHPFGAMEITILIGLIKEVCDASKMNNYSPIVKDLVCNLIGAIIGAM